MALLENELDFHAHIPFVEHLGFRLKAWDDGEAVIAFEPQPEHMNSFQVVHGGASLSLLDVAMAMAARSVQKDTGAVTIEMKTSFLRAALGPLTAHARILHRSATLAFVQAEITDEQGRMCAHATGTFKYIRSLATGPRSLRPFAGGEAIATD